MPEPRINFTLRLSAEGIAAIAKLADEEQRTRSDMARILISEAVAARVKYGGKR
jgi:hypothetical protein